MKKTLQIINALTTLAFFAFMILTFLYPELISSMHLTQQEARVIIMNIVSFLFLISFLRIRVTHWKILSLVCSFVILVESVLMLGAWHYLFK